MTKKIVKKNNVEFSLKNFVSSSTPFTSIELAKQALLNTKVNRIQFTSAELKTKDAVLGQTTFIVQSTIKGKNYK